VPKIIDNIIHGKAPLTPSPADIEAKIGETEARLHDTATQHGQAALEAEAGIAGAGERLAAIVERRQGLKDRLETLRSALVAAYAEEERRRARLHAKMKKENLARLGAALHHRDEAAQRLSDGLKLAVAAWRDLVASLDQAALPGVELPLGSITTTGELRVAVERELFRLGARSEDHGRDFPGGRAHDVMMLDCPERLPPLVDVLKDASRYALNTVSGEPNEAAA
jgi:hypothetical protein